MTSLSRAPNGDWFARKGIPKDVREAYKQAFGVSQEERFRRPKSLSVGTAKAELWDWDATVNLRNSNLYHVDGGGLRPKTPHRVPARTTSIKEAHHLAERTDP